MVTSELPVDIREAYTDAIKAVYIVTDEDEAEYRETLAKALESRGFRKADGVCTCRYADCRKRPEAREPHCGYVKIVANSYYPRTW